MAMGRRLPPRLARYAAMLAPDRLGGQTVAAFGLKIAVGSGNRVNVDRSSSRHVSH